MTEKERFWELCSNLTMMMDNHKYPDSIFYFKDGKYMFQYEIESGVLWCSYIKIWNNLKHHYYDEIQALIKSEVEEHFKYKEVTPEGCRRAQEIDVEVHFKNF